ncbi:hypothetical protein CHS0354_032265 [Potamilus streckersoni]|uniref:ORC1/DEAH AAA+ ATPase domain-containing protein n=1 Tax=Potamilus streckersoni TaxID=2493646 RepID=A0AAE0RPY3_9BIVA|nr:hypothetical protein CHS0354_032265 [Potamilus streckersoni]
MEAERETTFDYRSAWDKLKDKLEDELDDYHTLKAMTLMKDKFHQVNVVLDSPSKLLECLENNYTQKECFEILRNVFQNIELHAVSERRNLVEIIDEYENQLPRDCMDLIGREEQIQDIMKSFVENKYKGIWLCGLGGMGKTMLAQEICYRLQNNYNYRFINVDMKGKESLVDLSHEILIAQNLMWGESGQRPNEEESSARSSKAFILKLQVLQSLRNFNNESILLIDNMDDMQSEEGENLTSYLIELLLEISKLGDLCKLRVIITARHKFINSVLENGQNINDRYWKIHWSEIELNGLSQEDGQKLAMKSALPRRLSVEESYQVAKACGGCPLGICILSRYIRQRWRYPVADLISSVEGRLSDIVPCCIEKSFDDLPQETKEQFIQLSVFSTCPFNVQSTAAIWFNDTSQQSIAKAEMGLLQLKYRHMVECARPCDAGTQGLLTDTEEIITYALHPLVFSSISNLLGNNIYFENSLNMAKCRFLELYLSKLLSVEESIERERKHAIQIITSDKIHLRNIFLWNSTLPFSATSNLKLIHSLGITTSKMLTTFAKLTNKPEETLKVFKTLTEKSKELGSKDAYFFWSVQQAEACLDCDMVEEAQDILQLLHNDDQDYCKAGKVDVYGLFTAAEFHYVQGMLYNKNKHYSQSLTEFQKSLELYKTCKPDEAFAVYHAAAINAKGNVHFKLEDYYSALRCHQTAYELINIRFGGDFHEHKSIYLHNIGSIHHVLALKDWKRSKEEAKIRLQQALETYNKCIDQDFLYKQTSDPYHADRCRIRSDIYLRLKRFEEAIDDAKRALRIQKDLHDKEHPSITISRYQLARCYMKRASYNRTKGHRGNTFKTLFSPKL